MNRYKLVLMTVCFLSGCMYEGDMTQNSQQGQLCIQNYSQFCTYKYGCDDCQGICTNQPMKEQCEFVGNDSGTDSSKN